MSSMLQFPEQYFEGETRCNFYITGMMKRFRAAEMEILAWIDAVCARYGIRYILCFGSLIGAVRHRGYIPWDDDIDIGMLRADYDRFVEAVPRELPPFFSTSTLLPGAEPPKEMIFGVGNGHRLNTSPAFLERFHGCPYAVGVDVYVFDRIPTDPEEFAYQDRMIRMLDRLLELQWEVDRQALAGEDLAGYLALRRAVESELAYTFTEGEGMALQILRLLDLASALCEDCGSGRVENREQMLYYGDRGFCEEHFTDRVFVPFEGVLEVPIPRAYDPLLRRIFGDYETPRKFTGQHAYPAYRYQREVLYEEYRRRGWEIPETFLEYDADGELIAEVRQAMGAGGGDPDERA